jgi:hypothetical protein
VSASLRAAHLLIQQTESRAPWAGTHDEELALLLSHPQLKAQAVEWHRAAEEASGQPEVCSDRDKT